MKPVHLDIKKKKYDDSASDKDRKDILSRVWMHNENIIYYMEVVIISPFTIDLMFGKVLELAKKTKPCGLLLDLRNCDVPDAETRRAINEQFSEICELVDHCAFVSGKNIIINTAVKFVMFQTDLKSFSINKTQDEGVNKINEVINEK